MKVLVACEESQRVCTEFRAKGHEAYSCDVIECSGGHPEWHIQSDVLPLLNGGVQFQTMDGLTHKVDGKWDMIIAFPPCTYLTTAATQCHSLKVYSKERIAERTQKRIDAMQFFMRFVNADCDKIAIENPVGVMNTCFRKPDQMIEPYEFAESVDDTKNYQLKKTCLWLKNIPTLQTNNLPKPSPVCVHKRQNGKLKNIYFTENHGKIGDSKDGKQDAEARSKTFPAVAHAMAEQWG